VSDFIFAFIDLDRQILSRLTFSHHVELCDDEDTDRLVETRTHTQALLVRAPVQAGDWLSGQSDVL